MKKWSSSRRFGSDRSPYTMSLPFATFINENKKTKFHHLQIKFKIIHEQFIFSCINVQNDNTSYVIYFESDLNFCLRVINKLCNKYSSNLFLILFVGNHILSTRICTEIYLKNIFFLILYNTLNN